MTGNFDQRLLITGTCAQLSGKYFTGNVLLLSRLMLVPDPALLLFDLLSVSLIHTFDSLSLYSVCEVREIH